MAYKGKLRLQNRFKNDNHKHSTFTDMLIMSD